MKRARLSLILSMLGTLIAGVVVADPAATPIDPSIGKVEVTLDLPRDKPYVGEMIMLRMRSFIRADIALDAIEQPPLTNFDWQQLGRDKPIQAMVDGFEVSGFERDIAIFPQQAGRLIIEPFTRRVTLVVGNDMRRVQTEFSSKQIFVDVQNTNAVAPPGSWWLPAKSLTLTDTWSTEPDEIKPGTLSRRTITIQAVGLTADRLPPPPVMSAPGTIAFKGPVNRETIVTEDGPVARATYVWDIRPVSPSPARLSEISIPWYDTTERHIRIAAIPDTWVAYIGTLVHPSHEKTKSARDLLLAPKSIAAGLIGFAWAIGLAGFVTTRRRSSPMNFAERRRLKALKRAGRFGDEAGVRNMLSELARSNPARWTTVSRLPQIETRLAAFDAARYAPTPSPQSTPPLALLTTDFAWLWIEAAGSTVTKDGLPSLDGDLVHDQSWQDRLGRKA